MTPFEQLQDRLRGDSKRWLVTGAAGFIGSNLVEALLRLDQQVVGLDNFATGRRVNLDQVEALVGPDRWERFEFLEGDIRDSKTCVRACASADYVLHQAALGSVPASMDDPIRANDHNVTGFLQMLNAAREAGVKRVVYATSSAVYGDNTDSRKVEAQIGNALSPYAVTKRINELYGEVFGECYGTDTIGLRYFNVFGPRQDPDGAYAAVIPKWIDAMIRGHAVRINGDGETSRDFVYIRNVVQANLLAATTENPEARNQVCNVAMDARTSLNELFELLRSRLAPRFPGLGSVKPEYDDFRPGDIRHSQADIGKARVLLGYAPTHDVGQGLDEALDWYIRQTAGEPEGAGR